jgi:Peptidase family M28
VIAHRDGFFEAAGDNASGVATMLGLAEYFAKLPKSRRRRTMVFIGMDGHHNVKPGGFGREWLVANRERFFAKTALMINAEHPAEMLSHGGTAGGTTAAVPLEWYAGGQSRPQLRKIASDAFHEFGVPVWAAPSERPPAGELGRFYWFVPGVVAQSNDFAAMHTAGDTPDIVPWTGLEAVTRAYARIIEGVNKLPLQDLQRPADADPNAPATPEGYLSLAHCEAWISDSTKACVQ